ncbi:MAG: hypothetical protein AB8B82_12950 [Roseovarius sp.]
MTRRRNLVIAAAALTFVGAGAWTYASHAASGPFQTALSACTAPILRPSTIESELSATQAYVEDLQKQGWALLDVRETPDYDLYLSVFGIGPELLKVAAEGDEYGTQYQGYAPHDYWTTVRNYVPPGLLNNLEPPGPNGRARWLASLDERAVLKLNGPPATGCTFYQAAAQFDAAALSGVPVAKIPGYTMGPYRYHSDPDAAYDGGITEALMIDGAPFKDILRDDVPSVWQISIRRPF